jgi:hypothetical protein
MWTEIAQAFGTVLALIAALTVAVIALVLERKRDGERAADKQRFREAADARLSATAYALAQQLRLWITETNADFREVIAASAQANWAIHDDLSKKVMTRAAHEGGAWAMRHLSPEYIGPAEDRIRELVLGAPHSSPALADSVRNAYVLFYQSTARLRKQTAIARAGVEDFDLWELVAAYNELNDCLGFLDDVVGPELRAARRNLTGQDSFQVVQQTRAAKSRVAKKMGWSRRPRPGTTVADTEPRT